MLILLPPSESKTPPRSGRPVKLTELSHPVLNPARDRVLTRLVELCSGVDRTTARDALGLSPGQDAELDRNAALRVAPARPAGQLYTGVLYDALDLGTLPAAARARLRRCVLVCSGLWGVLRLADRVPAYRCGIGARLPGIGGLAAYWRRVLGPVLTEAAGAGPVLDLRSTGYAAMWRPTGELADRTVTVRVVQERIVAGEVRRFVVSHFNKATKGRLVRDLALAGVAPRTPGALVAALRDLRWTVEERPIGSGRSTQLDLVVAEL